MARPLRIESEEGVYHVLNRGNYRFPIFRADKTKAAFLVCLGEACQRTHWVIHAWCVMSNHYHLAISTPRANLVEGMQWLQGTFATRFNRLRDERGHLFQGRYKSLIVEPGAGLGSLCHYIHLNPVRAGLCTVPGLARYRWTSLHWLSDGSVTPSWYAPEAALLHAGNLTDSTAGVQQYLDYLGWLAEDEPSRKRQQFDKMSKGWIVGSPEFAKLMVREQRELMGRGPQLASELQAAREAGWSEELAQQLRLLGRTQADLEGSSKSANWKLQLAVALKAQTTVTNRWLGQNLFLGARDEVSRKINAWLRRAVQSQEDYCSATDHIP